ncbi:unnamed protein product [Sphagnum balticum]
MHLLNLMPLLHNSQALEEGQYHMVWRIWLLHRVGAVTLEEVSLENRLGPLLLTVISKQQTFVSATLTKFLVTTNPDEST